MYINLYNFGKRNNSTKQPTGNGTQLDGVTREPFNPFAPVVGFEFASGVIPTISYNYAYIPTAVRYYFINGWEYSEGLWWATMEVDVLASFKSLIGGSTEYVVRSASAYNSAIMDSLYPTSNILQYTYDASDTAIFTSNPKSGWVNSLNNGWYVVGVINNDANAIGGVCYYVMQQTVFASLMHFLMDATSYMGNVTDVTADMLKALVNPIQYIVSCKWFPVEPPMSASSVTVKVGWYTTSISAYRLTNTPSKFNSLGVMIPKHPQSARGQYLFLSPYTEYELFIPTIGNVPLDTTKLVNATSINGAIQVDYITGKSAIHLQTNTYYQGETIVYGDLGWYYGECGVDIQLSQVLRDDLNMMVTAVKSGADTLQNAFSLNIAGAISSAATGIQSTIQATIPQVEKTGGNGSFLRINEGSALKVKFAMLVDEDSADRGRPLCTQKQISTLSGFVMCSDVHPAFAGTTQEERELVKAYMETGFFYE